MAGGGAFTSSHCLISPNPGADGMFPEVATRRFLPACSTRKMGFWGNIMPTKPQPLTGRAPAASLTNEEILRYSRHLIMPEVGMDGQLKLKAAKVLLIGTGGLGAPLGLYLPAAGVGKRPRGAPSPPVP